MPEHFHMLITEPEVGDPSVVMKVIKERFSRQVNRKRKLAAVESGVLWELGAGTGVAESFLRFQRVERAQARREAALYTPQPGEAGIRSLTSHDSELRSDPCCPKGLYRSLPTDR